MDITTKIFASFKLIDYCVPHLLPCVEYLVLLVVAVHNCLHVHVADAQKLLHVKILQIQFLSIVEEKDEFLQ